MHRSLLIHGPAVHLSSFSVVNRVLTAGLRARGWRVALFASDGAAVRPPVATPPDVYLFFGHPYDLVSAPGRCNVFFLSYDYARFEPSDRNLARRLNTHFDLVVVPSAFVAEACRRSGVTRPVVVCPLGVDTRRFRPTARMPPAIDAARPFRFVTLGGAYERKGTDVLLTAYSRAFRARDNVRLTIKAFSYAHRLPWVERSIARAGFHREGAPALAFEHGEAASVATYYRSADLGVFPFRGEGFGLPILECLASGTPVLATHGGGPLDFATSGVVWIPARPVRRNGREELAPDVDALAASMRAAYQRGRPSGTARRDIAWSVRSWTWERSCSTLDLLLRGALERRRRQCLRDASSRTSRRERRSGAGGTRIAYTYSEKGSTSWRLVARQVARALRRVSHPLQEHGWNDSRYDGSADVVVGQSSFCLEAFQASAARRPDALRVLHRENGPYADALAIDQRERRRCRVPPRAVPAMTLWRHLHETRMARTIVVLSEVSRKLFLAAGATHVHVIRPGIERHAVRPVRRAGPIRMLFVASDPFRKGARVLFDAWRLAALPRAELVCVAGRDLLLSPRLVADLVAMPSITFLPFLPHRRFLALYDQVDCVVLPTFEEGSSFAVADAVGRGIPVIVSDRSGIHEILTDRESGWIVPAGSVDALASALGEAAGAPGRRRAMRDAAYEAVRTWTWQRFSDEWSKLVSR